MSDLLPTTCSVETLPVISYQGTRVITTELLASVYGVSPKHIHDNFANNESRFIAGKHFYKLEGEELRQFKSLHRPDNIGSVEISPRTRNLTLWTERGTARHAKILDTDEAWDVYERMEDHYFRINPAPVPALPALITIAQQGELATRIAERFPEGKQRPYAWSRFNNHFRLARYRDLPADRFAEACAYIPTMPGAAETPALAAPAMDPALCPISDRLAHGRFLATFHDHRLHLREIEPEAYILPEQRWPAVIRHEPMTTELLLDLLDAVAAKLNRRTV